MLLLSAGLAHKYHCQGVKVADGGCPQLQDRPQNSSPSRARMESEHCLMVRYDLDHRYKAPAPSVGDRVLLTANETDQFLVKVMVRQSRRPEIGDKLATGVRETNKIGLS